MRNRTIRGRVIDLLAHFRRPVVWSGHLLRAVLRVRGEDTRQSWPSYGFVSELRYLAAFSNAGVSKLSDVENDAKFFNPL